MTRKEQIKCASKDYVNYLLDKQEYHNEDYTEDDIRQAFEKGAKWADEHPKNPWISVKDDLPCNHPEMLHPNYTDKVLVLSRNGYSEVAFMCLIEGAWEWNTFIKVLYWMPIPEPPIE